MISLSLLLGKYSNSVTICSFINFYFSSTGEFAYGFANGFLVIYDLDANNISIQLGNMTWPDPSFLPYAVDVSDNGSFVVLGYVGIPDVSYKPRAYLLEIIESNFIVLDTWFYTAPSETSWQAALTNSDADIYSTKYVMSVSIHSEEGHILLGIPIMNTIIVLHIDPLMNQFTSLVQAISNGKAIGMGKSVAWLNPDLPVALVNTFSLDHIWSSSQIFIYNITDSNTFVVKNIIPNTQQTFSSTFGPALLSLVITTNGTMVILDSKGDYYILLPSPAGTVSDSSSSSNSLAKPCMAGTFAPEANILPCSLCPTDTTTDGLTGQLSCGPCARNAVCSLGAVFGNITESSLRININQVYAYPISPRAIRFDEILVQNVLAIFTNPSQRCLVISPVFWAIIVISLCIVIWLFMLLLKHCVKHPLGEKIHGFIENLLRKTDLIGEGKMVIGGLLTLPIIVLFLFTIIFSATFLNRYPIEKVTDNATFACDTTLINAQFDSALMTTGIPPNDVRAPIFTLLNHQSMTLHIDFINTLFKCTDVGAKEVADTIIDIPIASCIDANGTLSISLELPSHNTEIRITLADRNTIGALRIRLEGEGAEEENKSFESRYTLLDLNVARTFSVANRLLAQQPICTLQLTKVINHTYPLSEDDDTLYNGIWLPNFSVNWDRMFVDEEEYTYATSPISMFTIVIHETSYYMLNIQKPIITKTEMIVSNLIFIIDGLELFGFTFLVCKLVLLPLINRLRSCCRRRLNKSKLSDDSLDSLQTISCRL